MHGFILFPNLSHVSMFLFCLDLFSLSRFATGPEGILMLTSSAGVASDSRLLAKLCVLYTSLLIQFEINSLIKSDKIVILLNQGIHLLCR